LLEKAFRHVPTQIQESKNAIIVGGILSQKGFLGKRMIKVVVFGKSIATSNNNEIFRITQTLSIVNGRGERTCYQFGLSPITISYIEKGLRHRQQTQNKIFL